MYVHTNVPLDSKPPLLIAIGSIRTRASSSRCAASIRAVIQPQNALYSPGGESVGFHEPHTRACLISAA